MALGTVVAGCVGSAWELARLGWAGFCGGAVGAPRYHDPVLLSALRRDVGGRDSTVHSVRVPPVSLRAGHCCQKEWLHSAGATTTTGLGTPACDGALRTEPSITTCLSEAAVFNEHLNYPSCRICKASVTREGRGCLPRFRLTRTCLDGN